MFTLVASTHCQVDQCSHASAGVSARPPCPSLSGDRRRLSATAALGFASNYRLVERCGTGTEGSAEPSGALTASSKPVDEYLERKAGFEPASFSLARSSQSAL